MLAPARLPGIALPARVDRGLRGPASLAVQVVMAVLAVLEASSAAHGHDVPRGRSVLVEADRIVININLGLLISTDGGAHFSLHCASGFGILSDEQAPMRLLSDGRLMLATSGGVLRSSADHCDFEPLPTLEAGALVMASHPGEPRTTLVSTATESPVQGVYRSTDDGDTFERIGQLPQDTLFVGRMAYAPSDPSRVYASTQGAGTAAGELAFFMSVSMDGGATFQRHELSLDDDHDGVELLAVHPADPDVIYARIGGINAAGEDRLVVSEDGGRSFRDLLDVAELQAFAIAPDGSRVWAGGADGMWRSEDGGASFQPLMGGVTVSCLLHDGQYLWVCHDAVGGHSVLSRSVDGGETLEQIVSIVDAEQPVSCPGASTVASSCAYLWDGLLWPPPTTVDAGVDGGGGSPTPTDHGGCGCRVGRSGASAPPGALAVWGSVGMLLWRRRRRGRACSTVE